MAIPAHWDDSSETPRDPRRKLRLEARGALSSGVSAEILVHDISATGLLIESPAPLAHGERIGIDLPEAGQVSATVVWESGKLFGCRFAEPISSAALSAAQLRSAVGQAVDIAVHGMPARDLSFGARLQRLRKERGISQTLVAERLGVSKPTVWAWEHDKARPIDARMAELADVLGVTQTELAEEHAAPTGDIVARSREEIAAALGINADRIKISIEL